METLAATGGGEGEGESGMMDYWMGGFESVSIREICVKVLFRNQCVIQLERSAIKLERATSLCLGGAGKLERLTALETRGAGK